MVKQKKGSLEKFFEEKWEAISYIFMGIGLMIFSMNITFMLSFLPNTYSTLYFNLSIFSSILLILYVLYTLEEKHKNTRTHHKS